MARDWEPRLRRWKEAGLIDPATVAAIERWEAAQAPPGRLRAPVLVALSLGAVLLGAGVLLFVSAHWEAIPPGLRFALLVALVAGLHGGAGAVRPGFGGLATALHGVGSVALGAAIFLAGQIFHLEAHWPAGLLLWAIGAAIGWGLLRQWPQLALLGLLLPSWLGSEWLRTCERVSGGQGAPATVLVPAAGALLLSLAAFAAPGRPPVPPERRVLLWLGGLALPFTALAFALATAAVAPIGPGRLPPGLAALGWGVALGGPLLLGWWLRGPRAWPLGVALAWLLVPLVLRGPVTPFTYAWWGLGGLLLVAWGVGDARAERINLGAATVAVTVLGFYFSEVLDKLGRSAGLIGLGVLFLAGGWALEGLRRRLVAGIRLPPGSAGEPPGDGAP